MKKSLSPAGLRNLALMTVMLIAGSCLDYTVETRVNKDGSVFRQYWVRGDSASVFNGTLKIPSDDAWKIEHFYDHKEKGDTSSEKSQYVYRASRTFKNAAELSAWLGSDTAERTIKVAADLKRKFRWFYTYYEYREIFPMSIPFRKIPVDSFLTEMEQSIVKEEDKVVYSPADGKMIWNNNTLAFAYTHDDSVAIDRINDGCEAKLLRWMVASLVEEYLSVLETEFPDQPVVKEVRSLADTLTGTVLKKVPDFSMDTLDAGMLAFLGDSLTGSGELTLLLDRHAAAFEPMNDKIRKLEAIDFSDDYYQSLTLPGTVFSTNADAVDDGLMSWDFDPDNFLMKDYVMTASSRVANPWIMGITAMVALLAAIFFFTGRREKTSYTS